MESLARLENDLNHFDPAVRAAALAELARLAESGTVPLPPESGVANMHCHTFFSFNAYGHSPSSLAWLARRQGYRLLGIVDFDVLDGVDEFLDACDVLGLRGSAGLETRVFIPELAGQEINSPGEPGIAYHMGIGFATGCVPPGARPLLAGLKQRAAGRNEDLVARVNAYLHPVTVDYQRDVLPLTPGGNPTERHIVAAYVQAAARLLPDPASFWATRLGQPLDGMPALMADVPRFHNLIRARLMKGGGPGYVVPQSGMFPTLGAFHELILACQALPCAAWLDGTSPAEQAIDDLLALFAARGIVALNIIPDRNWNIADPATRRLKVDNLYRVVRVAAELDLPLNVGTEMNSFGQKLVDTFDAPELAPVRQAFLDGAHFIYGHTALQRALSLGYGSAWAQAHLPARRARVDFYTQVGRHLPPGRPGQALLRRLPSAPSPADLLSLLQGE